MKELEEFVDKARKTFDDLPFISDYLNKNLKKWLYQRLKAFSEKAELYGLPAPRGLLLLGIQGTGKSLTAVTVIVIVASLLLIPPFDSTALTITESEVVSLPL